MSQRLKGELVLALEWIPLVTFLESCVGKQGQGVHCSYEVLFYFFPLQVLLYLPGTLYPGTFFQSHVLHYITWHWPCLSLGRVFLKILRKIMINFLAIKMKSLVFDFAIFGASNYRNFPLLYHSICQNLFLGKNVILYNSLSIC